MLILYYLTTFNQNFKWFHWHLSDLEHFSWMTLFSPTMKVWLGSKQFLLFRAKTDTFRLSFQESNVSMKSTYVIYQFKGLWLLLWNIALQIMENRVNVIIYAHILTCFLKSLRNCNCPDLDRFYKSNFQTPNINIFFQNLTCVKSLLKF